jgi:transposase
VIYSFIVVYSFYCDLKGVKRKVDMPETSAPPRPVIAPGSSTSHRPPAALPTTEEHVYEDLHKQNAHNNLQPNAAKAEQEGIYAVYAYTLPDRFPETTQFK